MVTKELDYSPVYEEVLKLLRQSGDISQYPPEEQKVLRDILKLNSSLEEMYIQREEEDMQAVALEVSAELLEKEEMDACRLLLLQAFPESFMNDRDEFIAHRQSNQYICLGDCKTPIDVECKVLEWFSRPAHKGQPYSQEWRNKKFRKFMLDGINSFLETSFSESDMGEIYIALGNAIDHQKTVRFIESGYDFTMLAETSKGEEK